MWKVESFKVQKAKSLFFKDFASVLCQSLAFKPKPNWKAKPRFFFSCGSCPTFPPSLSALLMPNSCPSAVAIQYNPRASSAIIQPRPPRPAIRPHNADLPLSSQGLHPGWSRAPPFFQGLKFFAFCFLFVGGFQNDHGGIGDVGLLGVRRTPCQLAGLKAAK